MTPVTRHIFEQIAAVIRQVVDRRNIELNISRALPLVIHPESKPMDDLGLDSIDLLDVIAGVEDAFGIEVFFEDVVLFCQTRENAATIRSVRILDLIDYLQATRALPRALHQAYAY